MRIEEAVHKLRVIGTQHADDHEVAHIKADEILLEYMRSQGHTAVVDAYVELKSYVGGFQYA
jgi:hypothetical protein